MKKIAVIGAGASGMMAAIAAAENARVSLFDKNDIPGRKLLQTGNGKCNFLNESDPVPHFRGSIADSGILSGIFESYDRDRILGLFSSFGLLYHKKNGGYYPRSDSAASLNDVLIGVMKEREVIFHPQIQVKGIEKKGDQFFLDLFHLKHNKRSKDETPFDAVIVATGGKAAPKTGSTGDGYYFAEGFGLSVAKPLPALTRLLSPDPFFNDNTVRASVSVKLFIDDSFTAASQGELQVNAGGPSGICIFDLSGRAARALNEGRSCRISVDFLPELDVEELFSLLLRKAERIGAEDPPSSLFNGIFSDRLSVNICEKLENLLFKGRSFHGILSDSLIRDIAVLIKDMSFDISGTGEFAISQVTSGGITAESLNPDLSAKNVPGLFFTGECLDADGDCGGFNLHWAWASGLTAGFAASGAVVCF
ncbi:MAG: aminoacetone oxidase family FAD-binding enzyme [Lachnospiraceae bacterium]|nr:aminoacetone oxidase family FAD-binding enzyme [Lachnospiraceae bacterium]